MPIVTQSRTLSGKGLVSYLRNLNPSTQPLRNDTVSLSHGDQTTTSFRSPRRVNDDSDYESASGEELNRRIRSEYQTRYDNGHDFSTLKHYIDFPSGKYVWLKPTSGAGTSTTIYGGCFLAITGSASVFPPLSVPSLSQIHSDGARGINQTLPTAPEANLLAMFGELRQRMPEFIGASVFKRTFVRERTVIRKGSLSTDRSIRLDPSVIGNEHLNVQFGVMPTVSDVQDLARAIANFMIEANALHERARDVTIRKRIHLGSSKSYSGVSGDNFKPDVGTFSGTNQLTGYFGGASPKFTSDNTSFDSWFSGGYTYHISEGLKFLGDAGKYEALANELLGTHLTPETIWELTPWSWVIDWFYSVNSLIENLRLLASDNLVLRYGYVMHHSKCVRERRYRPTPTITSWGPTTVPGDIVSYFTTESKKRTRATPYGFGVDMNALSARRISILAALGLTRAQKILHIPIGE